MIRTERGEVVKDLSARRTHHDDPIVVEVVVDVVVVVESNVAVTIFCPPGSPPAS